MLGVVSILLPLKRMGGLFMPSDAFNAAQKSPLLPGKQGDVFGLNPLFAGNQFHLHLCPGGELCHLYAGAGGRVLRELGGVNGVHGGEIGQVGEENGGLDHVGEGHVGGGQHCLQVVEDLGGLGLDGIPCQLAGLRDQRHLTGGEQGGIARNFIIFSFL